MLKVGRYAAAIGVILLAPAASAQEMEAPRFILSTIDWDAAAKTLGDGATAETFSAANKLLAARFSGIEKSTVPVLMPIDLATFRSDADSGNEDAKTSNKYFGGFYPSKFFQTGPAGYDATFWIDWQANGFSFTYPKPIEVEIGGAAFVYDLPDPNHQEVFQPPKELAEKFPGMRRILRENHVRYAFERFGVPYVVSIQCYDRRPSRRYLSCREADPVAVKFLNALATAGGGPAQTITEPKLDLARPTQTSDFTYYAPGNIIENTGWHRMSGRADRTVYARVRFPMANAPAYIKSSSFLHWGDCYRTGRIGRIGRKDAPYHCKVNEKPLFFNEANPENWTYPWRDNFCEWRDFLVGQCPGGYGHQGQDIRPSNCVIKDNFSDRCEPYQHEIAAVHDGMIWRTPGNLMAFLAFNNANEHVRFSFLHMNPKLMDQDGVITGRLVREGETLGKVANWGDYDHGTAYHLHMNMQVFTKAGWVWVNPYMTLVAAYERLIGGRGTEIKPDDPAPVIPEKAPVVLNPSPAPASLGEASAAKPKSAVRERAAAHAKSKKKAKHKKRRRRGHSDDE
ncbi:MAG: M23 family peptidase [Pseudolabrys sp.]|nr:M23 family peptidase [Pseudolabrys sp.]